MRDEEEDKRFKAVLFDLDGTLVDHFTTIHNACNWAFEQMDLPPVSYEKVRRTVGGSIAITMRRLIGEERADEAVDLFREHFQEVWREGLKIIPGAREICVELKQRGYRNAVFTNKEGYLARQIVDYLELDDVVDVVVGTLDTPWRKPEPEFTSHILTELKVTSSEACLVGDSPFDIQAARVVKMPAFVVATGSHDKDQLQEAEPDGVYESLHALAPDVFGFRLNNAR